MMKKLIVITLVFNCVFVAGFSQKSKKSATVEPVKEEKSTVDSLDIKIYQKAIKYADINTAVNAMYRLIVKNPERTDFIDSLITLYYYGGNNAQVVIMGREFLETDPNNTKIMEFVANSEKSLGREKEALELFEKLFPLTKNLYHAYQIGVSQFALKRYGECTATMSALMQAPKAAEQQVVISATRDHRQKVPISAAANNLLGVMNLEMNKKENAKAYFAKALEIMPEFALAKVNLDVINKEENKDGKK